MVEYGIPESGLEKGKISFVNIENLTESGYINSDEIKFVNEAPQKKILKRGELLISRSRLVGLASVVTQKEAGYTYGSYIIRFKLKPTEVIPLFVAKFFNSNKGKLQTELLKTGATGENINSSQLLKVTIPKISKENQREILLKVKGIEAELVELQKRTERKRKEAKDIVDNIL